MDAGPHAMHHQPKINDPRLEGAMGQGGGHGTQSEIDIGWQ